MNNEANKIIRNNSLQYHVYLKNNLQIKMILIQIFDRGVPKVLKPKATHHNMQAQEIKKSTIGQSAAVGDHRSRSGSVWDEFDWLIGNDIQGNLIWARKKKCIHYFSAMCAKTLQTDMKQQAQEMHTIYGKHFGQRTAT